MTSASSGFADLSSFQQDDDEGPRNQYPVIKRGRTPGGKTRQLFLSCQRGEETRVHQMVAGTMFTKGLNLESRDEYGRTPLIVAAAFGRNSVIKLLLMLGAEVNSFDNFRGTPLVNACANGHAIAARMLIQSGADIHWRDSAGNLAVVYAAQNGHWDVLDFLLNTPGVEVNSTDEINGHTPLMKAAQLKYSDNAVDVIFLLAERGADFDVRDRNRHNCFELARDPRTALALLEALREYHPDHPKALAAKQLEEERKERERKKREEEEARQARIKAQRKAREEAAAAKLQLLIDGRTMEEAEAAERERLAELEASKNDMIPTDDAKGGGGMVARMSDDMASAAKKRAGDRKSAAAKKQKDADSSMENVGKDAKTSGAAQDAQSADGNASEANTDGHDTDGGPLKNETDTADENGKSAAEGGGAAAAKSADQRQCVQSCTLM